MSLSTILGAVSEREFFQDYWERDVLHESGESHGVDRFDKILNVRAFARFLTRRCLRPGEVVLVKSGQLIPDVMFVEDKTYIPGQKAVDLAKLHRLVNQEGASLIVNSASYYFDEIYGLSCSIAEEMKGLVHANCYFTPSRASGFGPHWDTHDVFVLQIAGEKKWKIYEPTFPLPRSGDGSPRIEIGKEHVLNREVTLRHGDMLYLPRGMIHCAETSKVASLHVTLGVQTATVSDVLKTCVDQYGEKLLEARASVSPFESIDQQKLLSQLSVWASATADLGCDLEVRRERLMASTRVNRASINSFMSHFGMLESCGSIELKLCEPWEVLTTVDGVTIRCNGKRLAIPRRMESFVLSLDSSVAGQAGSIRLELENLSSEQRAVTSCLISEGFLNAVD